MLQIHPKKLEIIQNKKILAIDYGSKNIGLASFFHGRDPFPLKLEQIKSSAKLSENLTHLSELVINEDYELLVFGVPYLVDGKSSSQTDKYQSIGQQLRELLPHIQVYFQDETLTTQAAKDRMLNSVEYNFKIDFDLVDSLSALIILEDFLISSN